ncbi:hypothetical protein NKDENANG_02599 [Candidatus Entotheonellaceae bacterium PAL068K]
MLTPFEKTDCSHNLLILHTLNITCGIWHGNCLIQYLAEPHFQYLWTLIAAFVGVFLSLGGAMLESEFTRATSAINIMMNHTMDVNIGTSTSARKEIQTPCKERGP